MDEPDVISVETQLVMARAIPLVRCFSCHAFIPPRTDPCCQRCKDELKAWDERNPP